MPITAQDKLTIVNRSYIDNFSVKEFAQDELIPEFFPDADINMRMSGMFGYTVEQIANITEDVCNTGSVYFREMFPNRAQIDESIYSHAAIFQLTDILSKPSSCYFLLVLEESAIRENMTYDKDSGYYYFYIDKDTTVTVKDIPFILDYDIRMQIVKKRTDTKEDYIYTASYILDQYKNSISDIKDPYVKVRRTGGFLALEVMMHQCERDVEYETITSNSKINYPIIDIPFNGSLCGFDILYKEPTEQTFSTQMTTLPVYSQPVDRPFCYYQLKDNNTLRISFNTKDMYFMPEFNSEIQIILYITLASGGNFDMYNGTDIQVVNDSERYQYPVKYVMSAKPFTSSVGGMDRMEMEALQALSVESYRTAMALTTENDLQEYFNNFQYRFGNAKIKFIKLRDDARERVFSAFIIMYHDELVYKTNSLNLQTNLSELQNPEPNVYIIDPGVLFTYTERSLNDTKIIEADFLRDEETNQRLWEEYQQAIKDGTIPYIPEGIDHSEVPEYLNRPASFAEFKKRKGVDDKISIFDVEDTALEELDDPQNGKFLYTNPFLIRFKKNPNIINMYLPFVDQRLMVDFTNQNEDAFVQFISYFVDIKRVFEKEKRYHLSIELSSNINVDPTSHPLIQTYPVIDDPNDDLFGVIQYILNDPYEAANNDLRVVLVIGDGNRDICYTELIPSDYNELRNVFTFSTDIHTDDHLTSDTRIRILDEIRWRDDESGEYYMVTKDNTIYEKFDRLGNILEENIPVDTVSALIREGKLSKWPTVVNMTGNDDILIPCTGAVCRIETVYKRYYNEDLGGLEIATPEMTNNKFVAYDKRFTSYIWTNQYTSVSSGIGATFMYPLDYVRSDLQFMDYTMKDDDGNFKYDIMDVYMRSIPLVKWDLPLNEEEFSYFINAFVSYYSWIVEIINTRLRNVTAIDVKWYNTYGKSKNYVIGDEEEIINTVNMVIRFDMWFIPGTDTVNMIPRIKYFIKNEIERLNSYVFNYVHISNLMRKIESNFSCVDHIRFININNYPTTYQSVKVLVDDVNDLEKRERMTYVPEMLTVDLENIIINEYVIDSY